MKANNSAEMSETNEHKFVVLNETTLNCSHKMARTVLCGSPTWYIPLWGAITLMFTLLDLDYKPSPFFSPLPARDRCSSFSFLLPLPMVRIELTYTSFLPTWNRDCWKILLSIWLSSSPGR